MSGQQAQPVDLRDLQIDEYRGADVAVRITHKPTGLVASATHPSTLRAREMALEQLKQKLADRGHGR